MAPSNEGRTTSFAGLAEAAAQFMLRFDEERALAALPHLLPGDAERREAVEIVRRIGYADGVITRESEAVLAKIERILGLETASDAEPPKPAGRRPRRNGAARAEPQAS